MAVADEVASAAELVMGKAAGVPVYRLLGKKHREWCPISWWGIDMSPKDYASEAKAAVTKRIRPLSIEGKPVHTVGIPIHWGYMGVTRRGYLANTLTPVVGDANTQTPEFKAFLVDVEKA